MMNMIWLQDDTNGRQAPTNISISILRRSMLAVWLVVVTGIILLYECVRYIVPLVYYSRSLLRHEMLALFVSSLYPHYYGWWGLINYINEDFYEQWKHQVWHIFVTHWHSKLCRFQLFYTKSVCLTVYWSTCHITVLCGNDIIYL